ncbi:AEC family transporter [Bacillus testis]|uniref:AEC family transporter n=1 Tax=Bacillus testis TaxID=1622072 RepID=UPI00067F13AC|nr:AEC family transporter [Bacillus testis]
MFYKVLNENTILLIFMIVGYALRKSRVMNTSNMDGLSKVLTLVALPAAIIISLQTPYTPQLLKKVGVTLIVSLLMTIVAFLIGIALTRLFRIQHVERKIWIGCCTFSNILFIGIPIIGSLFGNEGILMLVSYNTVCMFLLFTLGIVIYSNKGESSIQMKDFFLNPAVIATFVGFILFVANIALPKPIFGAVNALGGLTAPLSMLITGGMMADNKIGAFLIDFKVYLFSAIRLFLIPAVTYLLLLPIVKDPLIIGVLVIASAMPSGAMNVVFAEQYSSSGPLASKYVVMTTLLSVLTLPAVAYLLG